MTVTAKPTQQEVDALRREVILTDLSCERWTRLQVAGSATLAVAYLVTLCFFGEPPLAAVGLGAALALGLSAKALACVHRHAWQSRLCEVAEWEHRWGNSPL